MEWIPLSLPPEGHDGRISLERIPAWIWLLAGACGVALPASFAVTIVLAQELLLRYLGLASGLILGLTFGTGGLGTAVSGLLADKLDLYQVTWILALAPALGAVLTIFIKTDIRDKVFS
jgi:FSR family fosmidomycin resistance protein-like MFS transporter